MTDLTQAQTTHGGPPQCLSAGHRMNTGSPQLKPIAATPISTE
jgi:hypothetical protein